MTESTPPSSFKIPNDELGRYWVNIVWNEDEPSFKKGFGILAAVQENGDLQVLGHAVVVFAGGASAICLGAAHSFDPVKQRQQERTAKGRYTAPMFRDSSPEYVNTDEIHAFFTFNGEVNVCKVRQLNYVGGNDIAVFTVHTNDERQIFDARAAVDFGAPAVGDEVAIVANKIDLVPTGEGEGKIELIFSMRWGVITEVIFDKAPLPGLSFHVRTTIPIDGGMSGGALVKRPEHGKNLIVIGIVSDDISEPEAFNSYLVAGNSAASMLFPALGLSLVAGSDDTPTSKMIYEMRKEIFDDRTEGVEITVKSTDAGTEILYIDSRVAPPFSGILIVPPPA